MNTEFDNLTMPEKLRKYANKYHAYDTDTNILFFEAARYIGHRDDNLDIIRKSFDANGIDITGMSIEELTKILSNFLPIRPSINWDHVDIRYNWLATDFDGSSYLYMKKPRLPVTINSKIVKWFNAEEDSNTYHKCDCFSSFSPGNCRPEFSLVHRPGHNKE